MVYKGLEVKISRELRRNLKERWNFTDTQINNWKMEAERTLFDVEEIFSLEAAFTLSEKVSSRGYAPNVGESVEKWRQRRLKERRLEIAHYRKR